MLAMHYAIELAGSEAVAGIRLRAAQRGPLFDGMAGLAEKLFLIDPVTPCYATFYLWKDPGAALAFLEGEFFAALIATFGRPEVLLLLTQARALPFAVGANLCLARGEDGGTESLVRALDPRGGEAIILRRDGFPGRIFEVIYHASGATADRM